MEQQTTLLDIEIQNTIQQVTASQYSQLKGIQP